MNFQNLSRVEEWECNDVVCQELRAIKVTPIFLPYLPSRPTICATYAGLLPKENLLIRWETFYRFIGEVPLEVALILQGVEGIFVGEEDNEWSLLEGAKPGKVEIQRMIFERTIESGIVASVKGKYVNGGNQSFIYDGYRLTTVEALEYFVSTVKGMKKF